MARTPYNMDIEHVRDVTNINLIGPNILDQQNIKAIREKLLELLYTHHYQKIMLNLSTVDYMSSQAMALLLELNKKTLSAGGHLIIYHVTPALYEIFKAALLPRVLDIISQEQEVLEFFQKE